jgi:cell division protein FtsB
MATAPRSPRTRSSGPGRSTQRRSRNGSRTPPPEAAAASETPERNQVWQRGLTVTRRAVALAVVVIILVIAFGGTTQIYLRQQQDLAVAQQQIRDRKAEIADLEAELARWDDPAYVKAQARDRLGWVMPGETGYRVVDDNGNALGGGVELESEQRELTEGNQYWWQRLSGSMATADDPVRQVGKG